MKAFIIRWIITTVAVYVASIIVPGMHVGSLSTLVGSALLLGIVNTFVRPVLLLLSAPFILLTMGIFIFVINALLLSFVSWLFPSFQIEGFWSAFLGSFLISSISWMLGLFFRTSDGRVHVFRHHSTIKRADARIVDDP
jgi:putative membrane protein